MIASILSRSKFFELRNVPVPDISDNEVRIRLEGCGVCASSIPVWEGREWFSYPLDAGAPGHEGWGIVEAIGASVARVQPGDRVAFLSGKGYAEFDIANEDSVVKLPSGLDGKFFPGEPLGCAMNIFERSDIQAGQTVAIIGIGFLGALLCQLAKHRGAKVVAISRRPYSLDFARSYGADEAIQLTETWEIKNKIADITGNEFCPRVIEATGKQLGIDVASEIVAEGGKLIVAGYHQDGLRQVNLQNWNWKGIDVINAHERQHSRYISGMEKAVDAVMSGVLYPEALYTDILPLDQLGTGFELTATRPEGFMKAIIQL